MVGRNPKNLWSCRVCVEVSRVTRVDGTKKAAIVNRELFWSWVALVIIVAASVSATAYYATVIVVHGLQSEVIGFFVTAPLLYGNIVYQASRLGAIKRELMHQPIERDELERIYDDGAPSLSILIPSYKEEPRILRQTLMSAALVEYPGRQVVVLIDDPLDNHACRKASRGVVEEVVQMLSGPAKIFGTELDAFRSRQSAGTVDAAFEATNLAKLYNKLADWLESRAAEFEIDSGNAIHVNRFFVDQILIAPARAHRSRADKIINAHVSAQEIHREYTRLAELLRARIFAFERKTYVNLSHAPNKAMNLNAYIGLIGKYFRQVSHQGGIELVECAEERADMSVPSADFLLTLDADSLILSDYALRLMHVMLSDPRVAVAQTPYSAYPNAPTSLERAAAATTDIQYFCHQGSTHFGAAYWVGANALLRVPALQDIKRETNERGYTMPVFIQDRTVIEDTGSTIDLIRKGWNVHNYPEKLAYSASPPDFGALIIQRRRWSNGGLIILPDLVRFAMARGRHRASFAEAFIRLHYLISPATGSICVLALLLYPFDLMASGVWLPLAAGSYYFLYGRDLVRAGYKWTDLLRIYALSLMLLPVNLAGVLLSISQLLTGRKASFGRTPKVDSRTSVPPVYFVFNALMLSLMIIGSGYAIAIARYGQTFFPIFNTPFYIYGLITLVGTRESWNDTMLAIRKYIARKRSQTLLPDRIAA